MLTLRKHFACAVGSATLAAVGQVGGQVEPLVGLPVAVVVLAVADLGLGRLGVALRVAGALAGAIAGMPRAPWPWQGRSNAGSMICL